MAIAAMTATRVNPCDPDTRALLHGGNLCSPRDDAPHDLMSQDRRESGGRSASLDFVQLGMTDTTGQHLDEDLPRTGSGCRAGRESQRQRLAGQINGSVQQHRLHRPGDRGRLMAAWDAFDCRRHRPVDPIF